MPVCSQCGKNMEKLPGAVAQLLSQYEGTVCVECGVTLCEKCHPVSEPNVCPKCGGELKPCLARYL